MVFEYGLDDELDLWQEQRIFHLASASRPALVCIQPVGTSGHFPGCKLWLGITLTTHPHVVSRPRMSRNSPLPLRTSMACSGTALLYVHYQETGCSYFHFKKLESCKMVLKTPKYLRVYYFYSTLEYTD